MPSSWSSRLLPNGGPSNTTPSRPSASVNKPLPRPPDELLDPPTLHHERPTPLRSQSSPRKEHARSSSNPLPKFFSRKKSVGNLRAHDDDTSYDDELATGPSDPPELVPARVISGKKSKVDDEGKISRRCMCCDSKVKVPKDLSRFRCLCCLTVNDLTPIEVQSEEDPAKQPAQPSDTKTRSISTGVCMPLSIERTRAIIDRCIVTYLEARCRRPEGVAAEQAYNLSHVDPRSTLPLSRSQESYDGSKPSPKPAALSLRPRSSQRPRRESSPSEPLRTPRIADDLAEKHEDTTPSERTTPRANGTPGSIRRKPVPPARKPPPPPVNVPDRPGPHRLDSGSSLHPDLGTSPGLPISPRLASSPRLTSPRFTSEEIAHRRQHDLARSIFRPLENYIASSFSTFSCLNSSFNTTRPAISGRARSESNIQTPPPEPASGVSADIPEGLSELDAKILLLGDIGENGSWWTGRNQRSTSGKGSKQKKAGEAGQKTLSSKTPNISWVESSRWYELIHNAGRGWRQKSDDMAFDDPVFAKTRLDGHDNAFEIESELSEARDHAVRTLLKSTENILKRPTRPLKDPEDMRFLLVILQNPSLYPQSPAHRRAKSSLSVAGKDASNASRSEKSPARHPRRDASRHTGLLKRIFGLLANAPDVCHRYLISWFSRLDEPHFTRYVDLVASFVTYRIGRKSGPARERDVFQDGGLIPNLSASNINTSAQLHSALGLSGSGSSKPRANPLDAEPEWSDDWQLKVAAKVMSILFAANNIWQGPFSRADALRSNQPSVAFPLPPQGRISRSGQLLHTSNFYNTLLDYQDLIADFRVWETKRDKFAFCQYPLFLSMGAKIKILEHDARRQMENKAREAYFDQVIRQRAIDGHFHLRVRRDCMLEDSFQQISQAVGSGQEELKKGLRVHFTGEEGVDAGGLRKEWFLLLVRDIFNPQHGMFVYDDESHKCYFNPNSFETSDQYYLVGALLGLAIYNSTILDVALPSFAFRKLLASAPANTTSASNISSLTGTKGQMTYTVGDLAEFRPALAAGFQQLLDFDGDVQATYCRDFVASVEFYGTIKDVPLIPNGDKTPVTNNNRQEYVDAYVRYLLDTAVARQFEPFKRGFFTVCAGNALSLFRAEEIELLVCGSDEALHVDSLKAVAVYDNWRDETEPHTSVTNPADTVPVIEWFWASFADASPAAQRRLLSFVTGTDRIPAVGSTSLILRIVAGGDGWGGGGKEERGRFPVARTCFNTLVLWRYESREQLEEKLWRAVEESEGFGLK